MRLFFALNFSPEVTEAIENVQRALRQYAAPGASYPGPENLHLTLAFLDEVPPLQAEKARMALQSLSPEPMTLCFSHLGKFKQRDAELWWLGAEPSPQLSRLQSELSSQLIHLGFSLDNKPFRPHVTLARKVIFPSTIPQQKVLLPKPIEAFCGTVSLMRSKLTPKGAVYTELAHKTPNA